MNFKEASAVKAINILKTIIRIRFRSEESTVQCLTQTLQDLVRPIQRTIELNVSMGKKTGLLPITMEEKT